MSGVIRPKNFKNSGILANIRVSQHVFLMRRSGFQKLITISVLTGGFSPVVAVPADLEIISIQDALSATPSMNLLFLGYQENNHHSPASVFSVLSPVFSAEGIQATFTNSLSSLSTQNLANYDALMMYGNANSSGAGSPNQPLVPIIQQFVENGGALAGLHVASAAFRNDLRFGALLGGRFQGHTVGSFIPENIEPNHSLIKGLTPLDSYDETYVLKDLNPDIHVLQERVASTGARFAWTWTRTEGRGRVFYTASGHVPGNGDTSLFDSITKPEFSDLVLRGLHWSTRRHFSTFGQVSLADDQSVWGDGIHRPSALGCNWHDNGSGPTLTMIENDAITVGSKTFVIGPVTPNAIIPCSGLDTSAILYRPVFDPSNQAFNGLWKISPGGSVESLVMTGQPYPTDTSPELIEFIGPVIGQDFVANDSGNVLLRARLKNPLSMIERSVVATRNAGTLLSEGEVISDQPLLTVGSLDTGSLILNNDDNIACQISLSDNSSALVVSYNSLLSILAIEGQPVAGLAGIQWGKTQYLSLNDTNELFFTSTLAGNVTASNDTALVRYSLETQQMAIILREGDGIAGTSFIGDLSEYEFVVDPNNQCHLFNRINGPLITTANDQVLLSIGDETKLLAQEGDNLPTFISGTSLGSALGTSPLISDEDGNLYFVADVNQSGDSRCQLFQAIDSTLFGVLGAGDIISSLVGTSFEIESVLPFQASYSGGGLPSPVGNGQLAVITKTTAGQQLLLRVGNLLDFDQDGFPNIMEAGLGSDPFDFNVNRQLLPKIEFKDGAPYYTFMRATQSGLPLPNLEESSNLLSWSASSSAVQIWEDQSEAPQGFEKLSKELIEIGSNSLFLRLTF